MEREPVGPQGPCSVPLTVQTDSSHTGVFRLLTPDRLSKLPFRWAPPHTHHPEPYTTVEVRTATNIPKETGDWDDG